ncbi:hypothetical protein IWZ01DRAFT_233801 [Phyllosticta capitalensis]
MPSYIRLPCIQLKLIYPGSMFQLHMHPVTHLEHTLELQRFQAFYAHVAYILARAQGKTSRSPSPFSAANFTSPHLLAWLVPLHCFTFRSPRRPAHPGGPCQPLHQSTHVSIYSEDWPSLASDVALQGTTLRDLASPPFESASSTAFPARQSSSHVFLGCRVCLPTEDCCYCWARGARVALGVGTLPVCYCVPRESPQTLLVSCRLSKEASVPILVFFFFFLVRAQRDRRFLALGALFHCLRYLRAAVPPFRLFEPPSLPCVLLPARGVSGVLGAGVVPDKATFFWLGCWIIGRAGYFIFISRFISSVLRPCAAIGRFSF